MKQIHRPIAALATALTFIAIESADAQQDFDSRRMSVCGSEIRQHCASVKWGGGRTVKCLQDAPSLSDECKAVVHPTDGAAGTLSITVTISGIHSKSGFIIVTLGDDPKAFPAGRRTAFAPATGSTVSVTFKHLKPNTYAVTAFHDENENGKFDASFTDAEGFAASNGVVGPPSFEKTAVKVSRDAALTLSLFYF